MPPGKDQLCKFLSDTSSELGFAGISVMPAAGPDIPGLRKRLEEIYVSSSGRRSGWPEYMLRTAAKRADPISLCPWAKSLAIFAFPFNGIPIIRSFLPETSDGDISGFVAGYAGRLDYHEFLREKILIFSESLKRFHGGNFRSEIFVDTKPVAEKSIAAFSGLGAIGLNSCLLCKGQGSGTCLGILALDIELPAVAPADFAAPCSTCGKCAEKCPTGAITGRPGEFIYRKCRSYLTMERKGDLTSEEAALVGDWIFGCDICTSLCPGSSPIRPLNADLEWLLLEDAAAVDRIIKGTALEYPGLKLLRRNALAVLGKRKSGKAQALVERFIARRV